MADSAADVLGTPDIPANLAAVAPTGDATGVPTAIAAPATGTDMPTPMGSTPGTEVPASTDPEVAAGAVHQNWLSRILDSVGTILGGDKTIVATKHPDGSVSVEHNPSTTGEKWGRIAQAALGGAARGMAVGQGPGGAGWAFAAGGLAGLQQPQQNLDAANKEAANMNAQQLADANTVLAHQKSIAAGLANREAGITLGTQEAQLLENAANSIANSPNSTDLGTFTDMPSIMKAVSNNPEILKGHTNQALKVMTTADADGKPQFRAFLVDQGDDNRKNDKEEQSFRIEVDPKTGRPTLKSEPIPPQSQPKVKIRLAQQTTQAQFSEMLNKWKTADSNANKKDTPPIPKTPEEAQAAASLETDPVRRAALQDAATRMQQLAVQQKVAGRASTAPTTPTLEGAGAGFGGPTGDVSIAPDGTPQPSADGQELLGRLDAGTAALVKQFGEYRGTVQNLPRGKEREPFLKLVAQVYPNFDQKEYNSRQALLTSMKTGQLAKTRQSLNTAISHMGDLSDAIDGLDPSELKIANASANAFRRQGFGDASHLGKFETAGNGVSQELATAFKGTGAGTQTETNEWRKNLNADNPASMQRSSLDEALSMLAGRMDAMQDTVQKGMGTTSTVPLLSPRSIATLHRIPGGDDILQKYNIPVPQTGTPSNAPARATAAPAAAPAANNPAAAATAPGGPVTVTSGSNSWHFPNQAAADTFKANARKQGVIIP